MARAARLALATSSEASSTLMFSWLITDITMFIMICSRRILRFSSWVSALAEFRAGSSWAGLESWLAFSLLGRVLRSGISMKLGLFQYACKVAGFGGATQLDSRSRLAVAHPQVTDGFNGGIIHSNPSAPSRPVC